MIKKNFKEEFDAILTVRDGRGTDIGFPAFDFRAVFYTNEPARCYTASCIGGECVNCHNDGDKIHVVFNRHGLLPGIIKCRFESLLPNGIYPDGNRCVPVVEPLNIELTFDASDMPSEVEIAITIPAFKGDPFKYSDFTPAQLDDLRRPAVEAAEKADAATADATKAAIRAETGEAARQKAEEARIAAEAQRAEAEAARRDAEKARATAEAERRTAENARKAGEGKRASAETERQAEEATRRTAEAARIAEEVARATAETERRNAEESRRSAESARANAEQTRTSSETARQNAEQTRSSAEALRRDAETARQSAETARAKAEAARATEFAGFEDAIAAKLDKAVWDGEHAQFNIVGYYSVYTGKTGTAYTWRRTPLIVLNRNAPIVFRNLVLNSDAGIVFFDADRRFISGMGVDSGLNDSQQIAVADFPEDAVYVGLSTFIAGSGDNHNASYSNGETVESREGKIAERIVADREKENAQFGLSGYWYSNGKAAANSLYRRTGLIPVSRDYDIVAQCWGTVNVMALVLFDASGAMISAVPCNTTIATAEKTVTLAAADIPEAAAFFAASTEAWRVSQSHWSNGPTREAREGAVSDAAAAVYAEAQRAVFDQIYAAYGVTKDPATGLYSLNGLTDITEAEMLAIYTDMQRAPSNVIAGANRGNLRTNLWVATSISASDNEITARGLFDGWGRAKVLNVSDGNDRNFTTKISGIAVFKSCQRLKKILGVFRLFTQEACSKEPFSGCAALEELSLAELKYSVSFADSPLLSLASLEYLVANAANTGPITVTVHPTVYAKLTNTVLYDNYGLTALNLLSGGISEKDVDFTDIGRSVRYHCRLNFTQLKGLLGKVTLSMTIENPGESDITIRADINDVFMYVSDSIGELTVPAGASVEFHGAGTLIANDGSRLGFIDIDSPDSGTGIKAKASNFKVTYGEAFYDGVVPSLDELKQAEDIPEESLELIKWGQLLQQAAAKQITFATV